VPSSRDDEATTVLKINAVATPLEAITYRQQSRFFTIRALKS